MTYAIWENDAASGNDASKVASRRRKQWSATGRGTTRREMIIGVRGPTGADGPLQWNEEAAPAPRLSRHVSLGRERRGRNQEMPRVLFADGFNESSAI